LTYLLSKTSRYQQSLTGNPGRIGRSKEDCGRCVVFCLSNAADARLGFHLFVEIAFVEATARTPSVTTMPGLIWTEYDQSGLSSTWSSFLGAGWTTFTFAGRGVNDIFREILSSAIADKTDDQTGLSVGSNKLSHLAPAKDICRWGNPNGETHPKKLSG
jgi:hypothetical protein